MKRLLKSALPIFLMALFLAAGTDTADAAKKSKKVYYVVAASFSSFEEAKKTADNLSEVVFYCVYKVNVKGKTTYRLCCDCAYSRAVAQDFIDKYGNLTFNDKLWIWESNGLGNCVYRPESPADEDGPCSDGRIPALKPHW